MKKITSIILGLALLVSYMPKAAHASNISLDERLGKEVTQFNIESPEVIFDYWGNVEKISEFNLKQGLNTNEIMSTILKQEETDTKQKGLPAYNVFWRDWDLNPPICYYSEILQQIRDEINWPGWAYEKEYDILLERHADNIAVPSEVQDTNTASYEDFPSIQIMSGASFTLSLKSDGTVWAWGANEFGQCGSDYDPEMGPSKIPGLANIKEIAAGWTYGMALDSEGNVWTWGSNLYGELGDGTTQTRGTPKKVQGLPPIKTISAPGMAHTGLAIGEDNTLWCWGVAGQFSSLRPQSFEPPISDRTKLPAQMKKIVYAYGDYLNCFVGIDESGDIWEWDLSSATNNHLPLAQYGVFSRVKDLVAGHNFVAVLTQDGNVLTKGKNEYGELGNGSSEASKQYSPVIDINGREIQLAKQINAGCSKLFIFGENSSYSTGNVAFGMNGSGENLGHDLYAQYMENTFGATMASGGMSFTVISGGHQNGHDFLERAVGFNGRNYLGVPSNIKEALSFVEVGSTPIPKIVGVNAPLIVVPDFSSIAEILETIESVDHYKEDGTIVSLPLTWDVNNINYYEYNGQKMAGVFGDNMEALRGRPDAPYMIHPVATFTTAPLQLKSLIQPDGIAVDAYITTEELLEKLPAKVCSVDMDGEHMMIPVQWDIEKFDTAAIGSTQTLTGALVLSGGISNPNNLTALIDVTVIEGTIPNKIITEIPEIKVTVGSGTSASELLSELPKEIKVVLENGDNPSLPVVWSTTNYDPTREGEPQILVGTVTLKDGIINPSNMQATALVTIEPQTMPIKVVHTSHLSVDQNIYLTPLAPTDVPEDYGLIETVDLPETVTVILQSGEVAEVPVLWNVSAYDPTQVGKQEFNGELVLLENLNISNPQNLPAKLEITVCPKDYQVLFITPMNEPLEVYPGTTFAQMSEQAQKEGKLVYVLSLDMEVGDDAVTVCPITFTEEDNPEFTKNIPGEYTLTARLPDNFASLEDPDIVATTPFRVIVMEPQEIVSAETAQMDAYQSVSSKNLEGIPAQVNVTLESGMVIPVDVEWNWKDYDVSEKDIPGEHIIYGKLINLPSIAVQPEEQDIIPVMIVKNIPVDYEITGLQSDNFYEADAGLTLDELTEILKPTLTFEITSTTAGIDLITDYTVSVILEDVKNPEFDPQADGYYPIMGTLALPTNITCPTVTAGDPYEQIDLFTYPVDVESVEPVHILADEGTPFAELESVPAQVIVTLSSVGADGKNKTITTGVDWGDGIGYTPFPEGLTDDTPVTMEVTGLLDNYPGYVNGAGEKATLLITMTRVYDLVAITPSRIPAEGNMAVKLGSSLDDIYSQIKDHTVELTLQNRKGERHTMAVTFQLREEDNTDYDPVTLGEHILTGYIPLTEKIKNPDGLELKIAVEKKKYTISSSKVVQLNNVESGTPFENIGLPELVTVVRNDGGTDDIPVTWNGSNYNPTKLGSQAVRGAFVTPLPIHLENPNKRQANAIVKIVSTTARILSLEQLSCDAAVLSINEDIVNEEPIPGYTEYRYLAEILWEDGTTSFQEVSIFVETEME